MKTECGTWSPTGGFSVEKTSLINKSKKLVLIFADRKLYETTTIFDAFCQKFKEAELVFGTSAGEILGNETYDDGCVYLCLEFEKSEFIVQSIQAKSMADSCAIGEDLGKQLMEKGGLKAVFILCDGLGLNGSQLINGVNNVIPHYITVSGGLAGDNGRFETSLVGVNATPQKNAAVAIGFYGDKLVVRSGSNDGWSIFGPIRKITQSDGPFLYELDGKPALELYKKYLGDEAKSLPVSGLSFPCAIWSPDQGFDSHVIRTLLSIDEQTQSMTFAGDIPQGYHMRLMWGRFDDLIEASSSAAKKAAPFSQENSDAVSIMISCIGRKILMGQRIINEIHEATKHLGSNTTNIGFYSYGEIGKHQTSNTFVLHNQTMTITSISEII